MTKAELTDALQKWGMSSKYVHVLLFVPIKTPEKLVAEAVSSTTQNIILALNLVLQVRHELWQLCRHRVPPLRPSTYHPIIIINRAALWNFKRFCTDSHLVIHSAMVVVANIGSIRTVTVLSLRPNSAHALLVSTSCSAVSFQMLLPPLNG